MIYAFKTVPPNDKIYFGDPETVGRHDGERWWSLDDMIEAGQLTKLGEAESIAAWMEGQR